MDERSLVPLGSTRLPIFVPYAAIGTIVDAPLPSALVVASCSSVRRAGRLPRGFDSVIMLYKFTILKHPNARPYLDFS